MNIYRPILFTVEKQGETEEPCLALLSVISMGLGLLRNKTFRKVVMKVIFSWAGRLESFWQRGGSQITENLW